MLIYLRKYCLHPRTTAVLTVILFFSMVNPTRAWKPSTHVYLALQALSEILSTTDRLGNSKDAGTVPIYTVDYNNSRMGTSVIGYYPADPALLIALENHRNEFVAGVLGPDAYPDIVTGQTRIHVETPVTTNAWLEYLWRQAQNKDPEILAFVTGYLAHAAGDMFMHTYINYYAGGPFTFNQSSNGLKHVVLEGYIGKRTPDIDAELWDLPIKQKVLDFIYENLVDARRGTELHGNLLKTDQMGNADPTQLASFPMLFSVLRDGLQDQIDIYDAEIARFDKLIAEKTARAEACGTVINPACSQLYTDLNLTIGQKATYQSANFLQTEYIRAWENDVETGLKAWPEFSHQMAKALVFNKNGMDLQKAESLANDFQIRYVLKMAGVPDGVSGTLLFIESIKEIIFPQEIRNQIDAAKSNLLDMMLLATWGRTREQIEAEFKNPELYLDQVMALPDPNAPETPHAIKLRDLNVNQLGLTDTGFNNKAQRFDPYAFPPAYNTINMIKLMLISPEGIAQLRADLGCSEDACPMAGENAMLGFIKSLDGGNQWHRAEGVAWRPGPNEPQMVFADCNAYPKLFLRQIGEVDICPTQLAMPVLTPGDKTSKTPITVSMTHAEQDAQIFYTISEVNAPVMPSNNPSQTRSRLYTEPIQIVAPLVGEPRPFVVRAQAFKDGFGSSDIAEATYTVDARLAKPTFSPAGGDFSGSVTVVLGVPAGATLFYTINGQAPDYNSTRYTGAIKLGVGQHTIRAVAYRIGYTQSQVVEATFNVFDARTDRVADVEFFPRGSGQFTTSLDVNMFTRTQGATVRYTIAKDQVPATPTESSSVFTNTFYPGLGNWFIRAKAFKPGMPPSPVNQINYNISKPLGVVNNVVFSPNGGTFSNDVAITLSSTTTPSTTGIQIFYATEGKSVVVDPQLPGNYKDRPFTLRRSGVVTARARRQFFTWSGESQADFQFVCATPVISPASGTFLDQVTVTLETPTSGASLKYTTNGAEPDEKSTAYTGPFVLNQNTTLKVKAFKNGYSFSKSASANFVINKPARPAVVRQPVSRTVASGETVQLIADFSGAPEPSIQWQKDGKVLAGATKASLSIGPAVLTDAGSYQATAVNKVGSVSSDPVTLTVLPVPVAPRITAQPQDIITDVGESVSFEVVAVGTPDPIYKWFRNGRPLNAQTNAQLPFSSVNLSHVGNYQVQISNSAGILLSDQVTLTLNVISDVESNGSEIPDQFSLAQNYPNPFNPTTTISFALPRQSHVRLSLIDILGREIAILVDKALPSGQHKTVFDAKGLASGTYFIRIKAADFIDTKRMLFLK